MSIEIVDLKELGAYCAHSAKHRDPSRTEGEPDIFTKLACAERWGEFTVKASKQYGGPVEQSIGIGLQYAQKTDEAESLYAGPQKTGDQERYNLQTIEGAADILSRFWTHRDAMRIWLSTQVFIKSPVSKPIMGE